ncbi:hypothetical protein D030_0763A, partial [Vibrio parahaemolyticus AQ3810]
MNAPRRAAIFTRRESKSENSLKPEASS